MTEVAGRPLLAFFEDGTIDADPRLTVGQALEIARAIERIVLSQRLTTGPAAGTVGPRAEDGGDGA